MNNWKIKSAQNVHFNGQHFWRVIVWPVKR